MTISFSFAMFAGIHVLYLAITSPMNTVNFVVCGIVYYGYEEFVDLTFICSGVVRFTVYSCPSAALGFIWNITELRVWFKGLVELLAFTPPTLHG